MAILASGCISTPPEVSPGTGTYENTVYVSLNIADADHIYYTLDGTAPADNCLEYFGGTIEVDHTLVLKYIVVRGNETSVVTTISYEILNGSGSGGGSEYLTNGDMVRGWYEYQGATRQIFKDKFFAGCEPVVRCNDFTIDDLNLWFICEDDSITTKAACETAGHGWITWNVEAEGFGGKSTFTYSNYSYTLAQGCNLTAEMGTIVGHFNDQGTGSTSTAEGVTIHLSGCYNGTIDDSAKAVLRNVESGFYEATCSDAGCSPNTEIYLISKGTPDPIFKWLPPANGDASCTAPYYVIRNQWNDRCLESGNTVSHKICTGFESQRWNVVDDASAGKQLVSVATGQCLTMDTSDQLLHLYMPKMANCAVNNNTQRFYIYTLDGNNEHVQLRPDTTRPNGTTPCISADLNAANNPALGWVDCKNDGIHQYAFFLDGQFPATPPANL